MRLYNSTSLLPLKIVAAFKNVTGFTNRWCLYKSFLPIQVYNIHLVFRAYVQFYRLSVRCCLCNSLRSLQVVADFSNRYSLYKSLPPLQTVTVFTIVVTYTNCCCLYKPLSMPLQLYNGVAVLTTRSCYLYPSGRLYSSTDCQFVAASAIHCDLYRSLLTFQIVTAFTNRCRLYKPLLSLQSL